MTINIYRSGTYINAVESGEALRKWIIANVPYDNVETIIPSSTGLGECIEVASGKGYEFRTEDVTERIDRILEVARLEEVAAQFIELKKRGENYTFDCPFCDGEQSGYISPKHQIYKCFVCGKTGNVVNFVMDIKKCSFEMAERYLEKFYNIL